MPGPLDPLTGRAVKVLRECERLESLQLCLQVCERADKRFDTLYRPTGCQSGGGRRHRGRRSMKVEIRDPVGQEPTRMNKMQRAFEPLLELENVAQKVIINGLVLREFYDELSRTLSADGGDELGPEKLFSAQGERIATGRNAVLHGHMPLPQ